MAKQQQLINTRKASSQCAIQRKKNASRGPILQDNRPGQNLSPLQLESRVRNSGQPYVWGNQNQQDTMVGHIMEAWLDPGHPIRGESASVNRNQNHMMEWIRSEHQGLEGNNLVKGHLLNDNLGGKALDINLFPITGRANKAHEELVEREVKNRVWRDQRGVYYKVSAEMYSDRRRNAPDRFKCEIEDWNPQNDQTFGGKTSTTIVSDLGPFRTDLARNRATPNPDNKPRIKNFASKKDAFRQGRALEPVSGSRGLARDWGEIRNRNDNTESIDYESGQNAWQNQGVNINLTDLAFPINSRPGRGGPRKRGRQRRGNTATRKRTR